MKLEINIQERKIRLLEEVNIGELFTFLEEILPDLKWREYSIEGNSNNDYGYPVIVTPVVPNYTPNTPYNPIGPNYPNPSYPWVTYCTSKDDNDVPGIGRTSFTISHTSSTGEIK